MPAFAGESAWRRYHLNRAAPSWPVFRRRAGRGSWRDDGHAPVRPRAEEVLGRAPDVLAAWGFDPAPLETFRERLDTGRVPADDLLDVYDQEGSVEGVLRHLTDLVPVEAVDAAVGR